MTRVFERATCRKWGLLAVGLCLSGTIRLHAQELIQNGNFMNNHRDWDQQVFSGYLQDAPKPKLDARSDGVRMTDLHPDHHHPGNAVALAQKVVIENGKHYRFSCEVRGDGGQFTVMIYAPFRGASWALLNGGHIHMQKTVNVRDEWQTISELFIGKFGPNDFKELKQTMRDGIKNHPEWNADRKKREDAMIDWKVDSTIVELWFAKGRGEVQVRNVSLQPLH